MLDLNRIQNIVQSYPVQELFAAMIWQRQVNDFDGQQVVRDLAEHQDLWASFVFSRPIYLQDEHSIGFCSLIETLLAMGNRKPNLQTTFPQEAVYPGDTLYILTRNQDVIVSQLLDLGLKWRANSVEVIDGKNEGFELELQQRLWCKLADSLWDKSGKQRDSDAVIVSFWWD
ncbi:MAG: hypothetical protein ACRDBG_25195 [Waterburya sp.]